MASNIPPFDFEAVYYHSELSITESAKSDTETELINPENNQHRVGAVSCHFRIVLNAFQCLQLESIECTFCCELSKHRHVA